jgi:hypothetical protein
VAAVVAAAIAVTPSFAGSFLTSQRAAHLYLTNKKASGLFLTNKKASGLFLTNKKASGLFLKKKAAANTYLPKATAPLVPIVGIAASNVVFGPSTATAPGYIPTAFTSFATKGVGPAVITFSGSATCTAAKPGADVACPIQILVDNQPTGKVNFAPSTAESPTPVPLVHTVAQTTVLQKGGHTIAVQYAGSSKATFTLKGWNLAVQAYPEAPEAAPAK